jgi:hypothetical protein
MRKWFLLGDLEVTMKLLGIEMFGLAKVVATWMNGIAQTR